jgi:hypothetical protein
MASQECGRRKAIHSEWPVEGLPVTEYVRIPPRRKSDVGGRHATGELIRSARKRGPDVWQFRRSDRGPHGKRIYRKRVIGTVCQYPEPDSAREAVTGLLRELSPNLLQRSSMPMTIAELCDHFVQRELTNDNTWR